MTKCVICEHRPAIGNGRCAQCASQIAKMSRPTTTQPRHFLTYRGHVVGLFPNGGGTLKPQLLARSPKHLPQGKTIDLNRYCEGYTREVIKKFKACILQLVNG